MKIYNFKATSDTGGQLLVEGLADANVASFRRWLATQGYQEVQEACWDTGNGEAPLRDMADSIRRGLADSAAGRTVDLGDFTRYADASLPDDPAPNPSGDN